MWVSAEEGFCLLARRLHSLSGTTPDSSFRVKFPQYNPFPFSLLAPRLMSPVPFRTD